MQVSKLFILANTIEDAAAVANKENLSRWQWFYVDNADCLRGYSYAKIWLCSSFSKRNDLSEIFYHTHRIKHLSFETHLL